MISAEELAQYTVKIYCPERKAWGTGFWVKTNRVLTCAHVVRDVGPDLFLQWNGEDLGKATILEKFEDADVALLELTEADAVAVSLNASIKQSDEVVLYGYSDQTPEGEPATFEVEGKTGQNFIKFKQGQVRPGMSGAPLLNLRTGRVCGMVKFTRDRSQALGGGAIPMSLILEQLPQLDRNSSANANPFGETRAITDPTKFWGRQELLRKIFEELDKGISQALVGPSGSGKSSILNMICQQGPERLSRDSEEFLYLDMHRVWDKNGFFEELCSLLEMQSCNPRQIERELQKRKARYVICLDAIDVIADLDFFPKPTQYWLRSTAESATVPLQWVLCSQGELRNLFPDKAHSTSPLADFFDGQTMRVEYLTEGEVMQFWKESIAGQGIQVLEDQGRLLFAETAGDFRKLHQAAAKLYDGITRR